MYKETIAVYRKRIKSAVRNIVTLKSRVEKRPSRFSFIGDAHKIPRGELRANALVASCAGNFALRARCKLRGERPSTHGRDAVSYLCKTAAYFCKAKIR